MTTGWQMEIKVRKGEIAVRLLGLHKMWNPYLGEKLYIGSFPHLSWFHRPLPTLSHNCSISLQQLQLLLTRQILKILWLSLHWKRCHCLVRQVPGGHHLRPCSETLFSTSNTKVQVSVDTSGPLKGEDGTKSLPSWGPFLFIHSNLPKIKWMWLHSLPMPRGWMMMLRFTSIAWGQDTDTNPFALPRCDQNKSVSPQLHSRESLYLSICPCCLDLRGNHRGGRI